MSDLAELLKAKDASIDATTISTRSTGCTWSAAGVTACRSFRRPPNAWKRCSLTATGRGMNRSRKWRRATVRRRRCASRRMPSWRAARRDYFPLFMLAIEAMCEEPFNLYGVQATTHLCAPLVIVNGPVAQELGINSGHNAFGPGTHSNATIGRAIRLALVNIGGAIPTLGDMSTFGAPSKFSYLVAENEARSPWEPLHVERGFAAEASTVTVVGAECPHNINDHESLSGQGILTTIAGTMAITGSNDIYYSAQP